jgi:lipopolysaccharide transport system ATP-binding protein
VTWKEPLYGSGQAAFGTDEGRIVSAEFAEGGGQFAGFIAGEQITIVVDTEYSAAVEHPHLSVIVQDRRMLQLGGRCFALVGTRGTDGVVRARVQCTFPARLAQGRYFITLRLEDRRSENAFFPLDKQAGSMSFEVLRQSKDFLGTVDLGMQCSKAPVP